LHYNLQGLNSNGNKVLHELTADRVAWNPARADRNVWEGLSVYLRKVGGLFPNTLCNVSGFSLPQIKKTDRQFVEYGEKILNKVIKSNSGQIYS
jgi:hypothetical protein